MSAAANKDQRLVIGGTPYADLLPPELKQEKIAARQRSNLVAGLVLVVFLVGVASGGATLVSINSALALVDAQTRSDALLAEQAQYSEVREVQGQLAAATASLSLAAGAEVDWSTFISDFLATMPEGTAFEGLTATIVSSGTTSGSPIYQQGTVQIVTSVTTPTLLSAADWLTRLKNLPGFLDVQPSSAVMSGDGYSLSLTVNLGVGALWNRYSGTAEPAAPAPAETPEPTTSPEPETSETPESTETTTP